MHVSDEVLFWIANMFDFVLLLGAARSDATPEQIARLRAEVVPLLDVYRKDGNQQPIRDVIADVMGKDWQPAPEWTMSE